MAENGNATIDKLYEDSKNMHINQCSREDRHSADVRVGSSRQKREPYRRRYLKNGESAHSSHAAAQPKIQTKSMQEPIVDLSTNMNAEYQTIGSLEHKVEAHDGPVSSTIRINNIDTLNQTINMPVAVVSTRGDIHIDYCPAPVPEFTGRQKELEELNKMFQDHQVIAVVGMGGVGKSQLARKYGEQYKNTYQYRYWIGADTTEKLDSSFKELADKLEVKAVSKNVLVNDVYKAFTKGRVLLIFDNVVQPEDVYEYLPTRFQLADSAVNVLITSMWTDWTTIREVSVVLQPFEAEVSLGLLQKLMGNVFVVSDKESWMELANTMGQLPLALRLSSSFIRKQQKFNSKFRIQDYITDFNNRVHKLLTKTTPDYGNNRSIYVTTSMTLESLGKNSKKLMNAAAYFNPEEILKSDLEPLIPNAYDLAEALADVMNYSLFHDEGTDRFTMHRLIQTSIQLYQQRKKKDEKYYSLTLEYALKNPHSNQCDTVFAYANKYKRIIIQNYKRKQSHRPVMLKYLLRNRCTEVLEKIFANFKDHIIKDKYNEIYLAVGSQCPDMFVFILSCIASTSRKLALCHKLFKIACNHDNKLIVHFLLENRLIPVRGLYSDNQTLLHYVAFYSSAPIVSLILDFHKEVIDVQDTRGFTALHAVIMSNNIMPKRYIIETVRVLIGNGASVVIRDKFGFTALHSAIFYKAVELIELICQSNNTVVNMVDNCGRTALHHLCIHDRFNSEDQVIGIARVLLKNGASVVMRDQDKRTPLHLAASRAYAPMVRLFIRANKKVIDKVDHRRNTALHLVASDYAGENTDRVEQTIRILIENGLSFHTKNRYRRTPMDTIPFKYKQGWKT